MLKLLGTHFFLAAVLILVTYFTFYCLDSACRRVYYPTILLPFKKKTAVMTDIKQLTDIVKVKLVYFQSFSIIPDTATLA